MNILGIYKQAAFNKTLRVGTPDPAKYHDVATVNLEGSNQASLASKMPSNHGYSGLRGIIVPRATRDGASTGFDHVVPQKVFIDPEQTGGQLVVDMAAIQRDPHRMLSAISQHYRAGYAEPTDAIVAAFAEFAEAIPGKNVPNVIQVPQEPQTAPPPVSQRQAPIGGRDVYVAPKASHGGSQIQPATFVKKNSPAVITLPDGGRAEMRPPTSMLEQAGQTSYNMRVEAAHMPVQTTRIMRQVVFELPMPGQPGGSLGQFTALFHDVVKSTSLDDDGTPMTVLVLVYDHSQPTQVLWFPPILKDPQTKEPLALAVRVTNPDGGPAALYLAYPTGVRYTYHNEEFYVLTVEKEVSLQAE